MLRSRLGLVGLLLIRVFATLAPPVASAQLTTVSRLPLAFQSEGRGALSSVGLPAGTNSITVSQVGATLASQTISFDAIPNPIFGGSPFPIAAKASSGLPIEFTSITPAVCRTASVVVIPLSTGICSITASQAGNASYSAAIPVTRSFTVNPAEPSGTLSSNPIVSFPTGAYPASVAVGDFNGDGHLDIATANEAGDNVSVLLGDGVGGFTAAPGSPFAAGVSPTSLVVGDFNGDGIPDLVTANTYGTTVVVLLGNGLGGFTAAQGSPFATGPGPASVVIGDFNGDGIQDLATADDGSDEVSILLGNGAGGFANPVSFPVGLTPGSLAVGDFNGDGIPDLATANVNSGNLTVLLGNGTGGFVSAPGSPVIVGGFPSLIVVGDFNGDGIEDLAVTDSQTGVTLLLGNGAGGFVATAGSPFQTGMIPVSIVAGDFNGDGNLDLAVGNLASNAIYVLIGDGSGSFGLHQFMVYSNPRLAVGDFNGDGRQDLAATNEGYQGVNVLLGESATPLQRLTTTSPSTVTAGTAVSLTFQISGTATSFNDPTGSVTFLDGTTTLGTVSPIASPSTFSASGLGIGSHTLTAVYSGDARFLGATSNSVTIQVVESLASQTITFGPLGNQTLGSSPPPLTATASSGLSVTFVSNTLAVCAVSGVTVTLVAPGTCSITASQPGNSVYTAATPVTQTFTVSQNGQTITFGPLSNQTLGAPVPPLIATASSGLPVAYVSSTPAVCTVSGVNLTLLATGVCSITASQAGNATYAAAASVTQSFTVSAKTAQTITFGSLSSQTPGSSPTPLSATASSGLPVTYVSNTPAVCTVSGVNLTLVAAGTCSITASQLGNATYAAATPVTQIFTVLGQAQTITFGPLSNQILGSSPVVLGASASSGLPVTFVSNTPAVCAVSAATATLVGLGTCSITASQAGNSAYGVAVSITQTFTVSMGTLTSQTITFGALSNQTLSSAVPSLSATASSGLAVTFVSGTTAVCTVSGVTVTLIAAGTCSIAASQAGNSVYAAAASVTQTFIVSPATTTGPQALQLITVAPCRIMDTRNANGPLGGPFISGGTTRMVPIPSSTCGIPANASAYSLNFTVVPRTGTLSYLTVWPAGQAQPLASTLNSLDGSTIANAAIVPAGTAGAIEAFATNDTDLIVDINGYFVPPVANSLQFYPLTPCRVLDTRNPIGTFGGPSIAGGSSRSFPIPSSSCGVPANAAAYAFNVTVVPQGALAYLTAWPTGQAQPVVSTLNSFDGTILANAAIVPAGTNGSASFYASNTTDLVVDINGYFAPPESGGLNFYALTPCRLVDTRNANGTFGGPTMGANTTRAFPLSQATCGLPVVPGAQAYSLNMTAVPQGVLSYLSTWPAGGTQPVVSTLNAFKGQIVANAAIVPAGGVGAISVYVTNATDVVIDTNGYFGP
jgi:hypothetical protein